jgi:hypothetical protein
MCFRTTNCWPYVEIVREREAVKTSNRATGRGGAVRVVAGVGDSEKSRKMYIKKLSDGEHKLFISRVSLISEGPGALSLAYHLPRT